MLEDMLRFGMGTAIVMIIVISMNQKLAIQQITLTFGY